MAAPTSVGILLSRGPERSLVRAAVQQCGMEALELSLPFAPEDSHPSLIVTDVPLSGAGGFLAGGTIIAISILDPKNGPEPVPTAVVPQDCAAGIPWTLTRPLQPAQVRAQLLQAAGVSRLLAERTHSLVEELHRTRSILDSMSSGVSVADATLPDMPLVYVNPAFERISGYCAADVVGRNCRFMQGPDTDQSSLEDLREAMRGRHDVRVLLKNYRKDGTPFWNELYMSPVWDTGGELTHFVGFQNDVSAREESIQRIEHLAHHDALTGLANRALLMEWLWRAIPRAERDGMGIAVLFFDLNNFKQVNDSLGHEAGDELLKIVGERLASSTRKGEMVARLGGDEFVAVLESIRGEVEAQEVTRRVVGRLTRSHDLRGTPFYPSASVGMALYPRDGRTPHDLLKAADAKMYLAKNQFHEGEPRRG